MLSVFVVLFFDQNLGQEFVSLVFHLHGSFQRAENSWCMTGTDTVTNSQLISSELPGARCRLQMFWPSYGLPSLCRRPRWWPWWAEPHRAWCGWWAGGRDSWRQLKEPERWEHLQTKTWMWSLETPPGCFPWWSPDTSTPCCCLPSAGVSPGWCCSESDQSARTCVRSHSRQSSVHVSYVFLIAVFEYLPVITLTLNVNKSKDVKV